jgi:hypothetical protein
MITQFGRGDHREGERPCNIPENAVAVDAEWDETEGDRRRWWLTLQLHAPATGRTVVYARADLPVGTRQALEEEAARLEVTLHFTDRDDHTNLLSTALPELFPDKPPAAVELLLFFSPRDVEYAVGWDSWSEALKNGRVTQHRGLSGRFGSGPAVRLRDLFGWTGRDRGLADLAAALGVAAGEKSLMDEYKANMARGLRERPTEFLRYAVSDVTMLPKIYGAFVGLLNDTLSDTLGVPDEYLFRPESIPMSVGRVVYDCFLSWLSTRLEDRLAYVLCLVKLGYLDTSADYDDYLAARKRRWHLVGKARDRDAVRALGDDPVDRVFLRALVRDRYNFTPLNAASVTWWAGRAKTETCLFNALVQGGRCNNEMPSDCVTGPGLDVDLSSCYGSALRHLVYPVGVPCVLSYKPNEKRPTLGEFLDSWGGELVPGLWQVVVSGKLPFDQDLVPSTLLTPARVAGAARRGELEGHSAFLRREVRNGVLTNDVLKALLAVASNQEWKGLMKLEVVTAAFYKASDRREQEQWVDDILAADVPDATPCLDAGERPDARPTLWHGVALDGFTGRLVDERTRLKDRARQGDQAAGPRDAIVKLLVNTLYGDVASRFFPISNTVLANNVTAKARVGAWMLAKALGLRQCITDGGFYCPDAVPHWKGKRPGLAALSNLEAWRDGKNGRTWKPLGGRSWQPGICPADADAVAAEHVRRFWGPYGLDLPFALEHKQDHTFLAAAYWGKADYALLQPDDDVLFKTRGKKEPRPGESEHPRRRLLKNILEGGDAYPVDMSYLKAEILKVGRYLQAQASAGYSWLKDLRPGDTVPPRPHTARENNIHLPLRSEADWKRRHGRRTHHHGEPVEWFECWRQNGIRAVLKHMAEDQLRPPGPARGATHRPPRNPQKGGDGG